MSTTAMLGMISPHLVSHILQEAAGAATVQVDGGKQERRTSGKREREQTVRQIDRYLNTD